MKKAPRRLIFRALIAAAIAGFVSACTETPEAPAVAVSTEGLWRDSDGVYVDTLIGEAFADMPVSFRGFYAYCSDCHSARGRGKSADSARAKVTVNTWRDLVAYGPERFVAAAKFGFMPPDSAAPLPAHALAEVEKEIASWTTGQSDALSGCRYPAAVQIATVYCGSCHTRSGQDAQQAKAYRAMPLDTYHDWQNYQGVLRGRLTAQHPGGALMPPPGALALPQDARQTLLDWLALGSPNTGAGTGQGDTLPLRPIVVEGAVQGLIAEPMRTLINRSCADCHTQGGKNKDQAVAWGNALRIDTYAQWLQYAGKIRERVDTAFALEHRPALDPMPKYGFPYPLLAGDRQSLLDWIDRGSPNTPDGK